MYGGDEISSLVFDIGSFNSRFGYSGEDTPKYVFQTQVGINKKNSENSMMVEENKINTNTNQSTFVGESELRYYKPDTKVINPLNSNGYIENQEAFDLLINNVYSKCLKTESKDHPVLFTEPGIHNKENRSYLAQLMFEKYEIPAIFVSKTPVMCAFSCGRSTCMVFDSGSTSTWASPVHDGYVLQKTQLKYDIAGNFISNELSKIMQHRNQKIVPHYKFTKEDTSEEGLFRTNYLNENLFKNSVDNSYELFWQKEIIRDMKESILSINDESIIGKDISLPPSSYELPDGNKVEFTDEKLLLLEKIFSNNLKDVPGFNGYHSMIIDSINKGDVDNKKEMFSNIFVTGGNTLFNGFPERLQKQLINYAPSNVKVKVLTHPSSSERRFSAWIGGSILSSLGTFHQIWFSKQEYEEHGSVLIERKCA
jgi:actin-related protein